MTTTRRQARFEVVRDVQDAHGRAADNLDAAGVRGRRHHHPRVTTDQVKAGTAVANEDQLLPGDLILIPGSQGSMTNPRHVGMYLGQDLIIHSPQTGDVVKIAKLSSWLDQITAIRRMVTW